ncbi:MAG TPA: peptide ABC transporter substrate-binding protein [Chloroflexia bacterium]|nr:peptide ABC transporter substrate-binding protein [Chloroflexia bacterium]
MSRNRNLSLALLLILTLLLMACGDSATPTTAPSGASTTASNGASTTAAGAATTAAATGGSSAGTINGITLPPDAAPASQQVYITHYDNTSDFTTVDFYESVYKRGGAVTDVLSDGLVRLDKNFKIQPGAATKWEVDSTGLVWTFHLDPKLMWSDDTPVTADDYVATLRYGADPKHAWDFTWYFQGVIKNWSEAVAGKVPLDQLGVKAVDANTLQFTTETPAPYLPAMLLYSNPLQKKALEANGGLYNSNPATSVSSGPYVLKEWSKGNRLVYEANPKYKGNNKPYIQKVICIGAAPSTDFASYQADEIDYVVGSNLSPADNQLIQQDPNLLKQSHPQPNDFRTDYLFFDTQNPPFNNIKVRQAFSHVIDRDALIQQIIKPNQGLPAYSFLMPGFPASNSQGLKDIQSYDVAKAKALLSEAGFPGGKGFPKLTLWLRNEAPVRQAVAQAIAASIKQNLGIDVEVSNKEYKTFTDALNAKPTQIQFGMVSYGMDFLDPSNMLSVWLGGGRHNWNNAQFDSMVKKAASFTGDPAQRIQMFQDAEKLLVTEAPGVFIYHRYQSDLYKPYLKGTELEPDQNNVAALHWPGFSNFSTLVGSIYISKDVSNYKRNLNG